MQVKSKVKSIAGDLLHEYKRRKYAKLPNGTFFDIKVDNTSFKLKFGETQLSKPIIERIEGVREQATVAALKGLITPGDCVIEIGACYGYFTNIISKLVGDEGSIYSIEGTPYSFKLLEENIIKNGLHNVEIFNNFLTNSKSQVAYNSDEKDPYSAIERLKKGKEQATDMTVEAIRLSDFMTDRDIFPNLIFMDIEGFEVDVITDIFENYITDDIGIKPAILFEKHLDFYKKDFGMKEFEDLFDKHHYSYYHSSGNLIAKPRR